MAYNSNIIMYYGKQTFLFKTDVTLSASIRVSK